MAIKYALKVEKPNTHYVSVELWVETAKSMGKTNFVMPVWTPGSYAVKDFSKNVVDFEAYSGKEGSPLKVEKTAKNVWCVDAGEKVSLLVRYRVYAFEYTVETSYVDTEHAVVNGASVFVYWEGHEREPLQLEVRGPPTWRRVTTSLKRVGGTDDAPLFEAPDYDTLVDSPIQLGNQDVFEFSVRDVPHQVSVYSPFSFDKSKFVDHLKLIVDKAVSIWGQIPYDRYVFIVEVLGDARGGLEHLSSTHCLTSIVNFYSEEDYRRGLALYSHEFFHAWNVKRLRPAVLGPFDYSKEVYTKSLWIAEGLTDYYDDLILRRAGIYGPEDYLERLANALNQMISLPNRKYQSAEESSFDSWIKFYRLEETDPNTVMSYYTQGAVIGACLDLAIRRHSERKLSLDDVLRRVYQETYLKNGSGYTDEYFEYVCTEAGGRDAEEIFRKRVRGREDLEYSKYLSYAGLRLAPKNPGESGGFAGIVVDENNGRIIVNQVLEGYGAQNSGLGVGDEIIGFNGLRVDAQRLAGLVRAQTPGSRCTLLISERDALKSVELVLDPLPVFEYRIFKLEAADESQKGIYLDWMGESWDKPLVYKERKLVKPRRDSFQLDGFKYI
jgi:predicted metalloprotease with PDZ domain